MGTNPGSGLVRGATLSEPGKRDATAIGQGRTSNGPQDGGRGLLGKEERKRSEYRDLPVARCVYQDQTVNRKGYQI